ncbi:DapH/DapD/GlmU-related protein [Falsochrobactrum ovis]|uniref:Phosphonate metabolism protein (Transferase hexapeptide repeat family) n=1 Tax=Falsochrobactrum ovis TaxID=1293442 RepID=A0A364JXH2_9HYPH|nr:DapH/DapD/GlmU-related protein [Falsochrobactrum ovis]RAK32153.1 phosphonate metabolism protein (transferase hexapeptide repeat family) [Falsochrobactrum ovis]
MTQDEDLLFRNSQPRIHPSAQLKSTKLGRYVEVGERVILREVEAGDFTYFERNGEGIYAEIGKFCSIAANVRINALEHPVERLTTHKVSYRPNEYFRHIGLDGDFRKRRQAKRVVIGNDVWLGHGAVILPGVTIGHGAVVGAGAVVSKDVPPYHIVAGVPAKVLRKRFDDQIIERLLALNWWDWPIERIYEVIPDIQSLDIEAFLEKWGG